MAILVGVARLGERESVCDRERVCMCERESVRERERAIERERDSAIERQSDRERERAIDRGGGGGRVCERERERSDRGVAILIGVAGLAGPLAILARESEAGSYFKARNLRLARAVTTKSTCQLWHTST